MNATVALIQARMSSSRFPGKVLEPLGGLPTIAFMVNRVRRARTLDRVMVVTSTEASDDTLVDVLVSHGIDCFRGDLNDVLGRYQRAAEQCGASVVVRLTGDCPLADPAVIDAVVSARAAADADYCSNVDPPTFPDGFDVECFTRAALGRAFAQARAPAEREHVTPWMRSEAANLRRRNVRGIADLSHLRLTVDYPDDLQLVRRIVEQCGTLPSFDLFDVLRCIARAPELLDLNRHARNEGLAKSLAAGTTVAPGDAR